MQHVTRRLFSVLLIFTLAACSQLPRTETATLLGMDGVPCVGEVENPPGAALETSDPALLKQAMGASEKGGVCAAKVFQIEKSVRVYRVWDSSKSYTQLGRWWALTKPVGPKDTYRKDYAICPSWSALDHLVACDIKPGTAIAMGPTQSAACEDGIYPKTGLNQVFIPNNAAVKQIFVENCRDEGVWP